MRIEEFSKRDPDRGLVYRDRSLWEQGNEVRCFIEIEKGNKNPGSANK